MRARLVRPEFWLDEKMSALPVSTRLTYIGLWGLADDGGYLDWNAHEIAAALYRFESLGRRAKRVDGDLEKLVEARRVRVLECGAHAVIPTLPDHRIKGGEQLYTIQRAVDLAEWRYRKPNPDRGQMARWEVCRYFSGVCAGLLRDRREEEQRRQIEVAAQAGTRVRLVVEPGRPGLERIGSIVHRMDWVSDESEAVH